MRVFAYWDAPLTFRRKKVIHLANDALLWGISFLTRLTCVADATLQPERHIESEPFRLYLQQIKQSEILAAIVPPGLQHQGCGL